MTATLPTTARRLTGLKPTGHFHLGNLLGAIRPIVHAQYASESVVFVADLHALTVEHDPHRVRELVLEQATTLLAAGVDPDRSLFYVQSHVPQHAELHYLLECATSYGEAHRMIQFQNRGDGHTRLSLLTYPVLMAADVLLHGTTEVPVGRDQTQHVALIRDLAVRFNGRYGETFVLPQGVNPTTGAKIMDLSEPTTKMGKSNANPAGTVHLLDPPDVIRRKVMRAVTDQRGEVAYRPEEQPGVSNLLEILAALSGDAPQTMAALFGSYAELKAAAADVVIATTGPIQARYADLAADPGYLDEVLDEGARRARERTAGILATAYTNLGLRPTAQVALQ